MNLWLTPLSYIDIALDGGVNPGAWNVSRAGLAFSLADPRPLGWTLVFDFNPPNSLSLSHHYLRRRLADRPFSCARAFVNCSLQTTIPGRAARGGKI
jgi:hypothetical protein